MVLFLLNDWYFHVHTMPLGWNIFALRKLHEIKPLKSCVRDTVILACLIGQFGLILWQKTSNGAYFFLVRATNKIKTVLDQKIPQKNYSRCKSCLSVLEHIKQ